MPTEKLQCRLTRFDLHHFPITREQKFESLGGKEGVIIAKPDIKQFNVLPEHDFIVIGCDGIFDKLSNKEVVDIVWKNSKNQVKMKS